MKHRDLVHLIIEISISQITPAGGCLPTAARGRINQFTLISPLTSIAFVRALERTQRPSACEGT
jgi:hypothetical protein